MTRTLPKLAPLAESDPDDPWRPFPVSWKSLDQRAASKLWPALDQWVRWLVIRYALTPRTIPPCWYQHGAFIEELSALRTAWIAAYDPDAHSQAPLDWHANFAATRARFDQTAARNGCTKDQHHDDQTPAWATHDNPTFESAIKQDIASRMRMVPASAWR